jgi:Holliday junction resolvase RusA-like endonuclease
MTRRDKWAKRPPVVRYFAFCDEVRIHNVSIAEHGDHVIFIIPMPGSWSKKKRAEMDGFPHRQKPDADNLLKSILDAVHKDDCGIWDVRVTKRWGVQGEIQIRGRDGMHKN